MPGNSISILIPGISPDDTAWLSPRGTEGRSGSSVAGISPSWIILKPRESSVRKIPAVESEISAIWYRVCTRGIFKSRYQVGISNLSGISKSHAPTAINRTARKTCKNPIFQRDRICLGFTFMCCQLCWTSALKFVELFREIQKQKTPHKNAGLSVDII